MSIIIDLSHSIEDSMPVYPGDSPVKLSQGKFLQKDGYNSYRLETDDHAGTHIDAPMHLTGSPEFIGDISPDRFTGKGCLLDVRNEKVIGYKDEYNERVHEGDIILLFSGHSNKFGTEDYYINHPVVNEDLAEFFVQKKIGMLGMDLPSPDIYPFKIHKLLFSRNIFLIENITNLEKLLNLNSFEIIAFPLKIRADASPVRVVARIEED